MADIKRISINRSVGAFLDWRRGSGHTIEIFELYVPIEFRRKKIGRRMVEALLTEVPADTVLIYAITRTSNIVAQKFYSSARFRVVAPLWNFYQDENSEPNIIDALMYGRDLREGKDA